MAKSAVTLGYELARPAAAERLGDDRLRYRLLLRPQATVRPDQAKIIVEAPPGWRFSSLPAKARLANGAATWNGAFDREHELLFELARR